eukprot:TRINITY_DN5294_c0_g1_i1.p2 TRINITY_DN5294_c0_g1~~TRINITY_DN5294_c0_g1_i1.p2  ORF type:complete len:131 (-),score=18.82 TRINITY_DN5294_c0_g1_i1:106-450(-)
MPVMDGIECARQIRRMEQGGVLRDAAADPDRGDHRRHCGHHPTGVLRGGDERVPEQARAATGPPAGPPGPLPPRSIDHDPRWRVTQIRSTNSFRTPVGAFPSPMVAPAAAPHPL